MSSWKPTRLLLLFSLLLSLGACFPARTVPAIALTKSASPGSVPRTGGDVAFTFTVANTGQQDVTLTTLTDTVFGDLNGQGTCVLPQSLPMGGSYECRLTASLAGDDPEDQEHRNVATATAIDADGTQAQASDDETVAFTDPPGLTLDRDQAARGEVVLATLRGLETATLQASVGGLVATIVPAGDLWAITVPPETPAGPQQVVVGNGRETVRSGLEILGDVLPDKLSLIVNGASDPAEVARQLGELGFTLEGPQRPLGAAEGPCSGRLANIDVGGVPLGQALQQLKELEAEDPGTFLHIDPRSGYDVDPVDHLAAVGAPAAHARGVGGAGIFIAVLDTGVNPHPELAGRLRDDLAFNAFDDSLPPLDDFGTGGHGTGVALLAGGALSGTAPRAEIMAVKTCDDQGICLSSDVVLGLCHALTSVTDTKRLVVNMSLGGDTRIAAIDAILAYATAPEQGVLVAAAGGNQGLAGSPPEYPAASDHDGVLAVAALEAPTLSCVGFEGLTAGTRYDFGTSFSSDGILMQLVDFYFDPAGPPIRRGSATIGRDGSAGGLGNDVRLDIVNLDLAFPFPLDGLTLQYGDYGGVTNLLVNGDRLVTSGLTALPSSNGGVAITVTPDRDPDTGSRLPTGSLSLEGSLRSVSIGGETLSLDEICPLASLAWGPADFSTRGSYIDIGAPGVDIRSGTPAGGYLTFEGTSFATPLVAGALALWREARPDDSPQQIAAALKASATPLSFPAQEVGTGLLNLATLP